MEVSDEPKLPMRAVCRKTALSPHVIRVWERRYGAVTPYRTDTKHRLYSEQDVRRLVLLRKATQEGHSISLIAKLPLEALESLVGPEEPGAPAVFGLNRNRQRADHAAGDMVVDCLDAVRGLDREALEKHLGRASTSYALHVLLDRIIGPLMEQAGELWRTGELRPAHEHMLTDTVRTFLSSRRANYGANETAPVIVVTTPAGQSHEIGALMVSLLACADGWKDIYLGPNLPADDIVAAVLESGAKALALSIVYPGDDPRIDREFTFLDRHLPEGTHVFVGGRAAEAYMPAIQRLGAKHLVAMSDFRDALNRIRS